MSSAPAEAHPALAARIRALLERRTSASREFFEREAAPLARCCHAMAERFSRDGRLIALGNSPAARSDVRHVAVEFVHPVIVGKRALPAIGVMGDGAGLAAEAGLIAAPADIVIGFGAGEPGSDELEAAIVAARSRGCLTVGFGPVGAEWELAPMVDDPFVRQELIETAYHVLWELVHVFFDHRGLLEGRRAGPVHDAGGSSFLYPFLSESEHDLDSVIEDVRRSALIKADDVTALREQTLGEGAEAITALARDLRRCFDQGGRLLAFGNGGSATDAMDLVADLRACPSDAGDGSGASWPSRRALDLTEDPSIITAIANDIGVAEIFQRQVIAYGRDGDAAIAFSTSGNSENLIVALDEARKRGLTTAAFVGYDGGRIGSERLADHVIVSRSQHIPRIQEAQASAYHVLRELIEAV